MIRQCTCRKLVQYAQHSATFLQSDIRNPSDGSRDHIVCAAQLCWRLSPVIVAPLVLAGLVLMVVNLMMAVCFAIYLCVAIESAL